MSFLRTEKKQIIGIMIYYQNFSALFVDSSLFFGPRKTITNEMITAMAIIVHITITHIHFTKQSHAAADGFTFCVLSKLIIIY
jgi:hypothetical protein